MMQQLSEISLMLHMTHKSYLTSQDLQEQMVGQSYIMILEFLNGFLSFLKHLKVNYNLVEI